MRIFILHMNSGEKVRLELTTPEYNNLLRMLKLNRGVITTTVMAINIANVGYVREES